VGAFGLKRWKSDLTLQCAINDYDKVRNLKNADGYAVVRVLECIARAESHVHEYLKDAPHRILYRGVEDKKHRLIPGLMREEKDDNDNVVRNSLLPYESEIVERVVREYYEELRGYSFIEKLVWMQHFGFPTRLLDVTRDKLVALYFATAGAVSRDGAIYVVGIPERQIVSTEIIKERDSFDDSDPLLLLSPALTERQRRQRGEFLLMGNKKYPWSEEAKCCCRRYDLSSNGGIIVETKHIPARNKATIMAELANGYGITSHFLFPEDPGKYRAELVGSLI